MAAKGLVSLVLLLPLLAGCIGGDDVSDAGTLVNQSTLNTSAPDGRGNIIAFEETNQTESGFEGVDHHHDMWGGKSRVVMFEKPAMMEPSPGDQNRAEVTFRPPPGTFVFEGTSSVEFTISNPQRHACEPVITFGGHYYCTDYVGDGQPAAPPVDDPNAPTGLKLRYKHASTVEWIDVGELKWGTPLSIQIRDPRETDMPHATSSVWQFQVVSPNTYDVSLKFTAKAEIVRSEGDIPLWPGHPLFYTPEKPFRVVAENVQAKACDNGFSQSGCVLAGEVEPVVPGKLISYGTRTLFIWANVTKYTANNPATAPSVWFLYHSNATGRTNITNIFDAANYGIEKRELYWVLPVDDGSMDSPYADGSRWSFSLGASYTPPSNPVLPACYGGCAEWNAEYTLTVIASSLELPASEYHMYCLDPEDYCPAPDAQAQQYDDADGHHWARRIDQA